MSEEATDRPDFSANWQPSESELGRTRFDDFGADAIEEPSELPDFPYLDLTALAGRPVPPRQWALDGYMPLYKTTLLTGRGGVGKSLLAQQLCTCVALGLPFLGVAVRQMPAAYFTWEDDHDELWRRQAAICGSLGVALNAAGDNLRLVSFTEETETTLFEVPTDGRGRPTPRGLQLEEEISFTHGLFVIDNATQVFVGDNDTSSAVGQFAHWLNRLASRPNGMRTGSRAGMILHHPNKAGADWLGSVAWENQFRSRLVVDRPDCPDPDMRRIANPKANYAATGGEVLFRWHEGAFARDEDLPDDTASRLAASAMATHDNALFLACLDVRINQQRPVSESKASRTYAAKEFAEMAESKGIGRLRLEQAMDRLYRIEAIERGYLWRADGKDVTGLRRRADGPADLPGDPSDDLSLTSR